MEVLLRAVVEAAQKAAEEQAQPPATIEEGYARILWMVSLVIGAFAFTLVVKQLRREKKS